MLSAAQLRLAIGDAAWNAIPEAPAIEHPGTASTFDALKPRRPRRPRQRSPRNQQRQRIALGGFVPAKIAAGFTVAEVAVLCVLAVEHQRRGFCDLTVGEIARLAGCGRTVVQNAICWADRWQIITVERRKIARNRNKANLIRIRAEAWLAWLRLGPSRPRPWGGGGFIPVTRSRLLQKENKERETEYARASARKRPAEEGRQPIGGLRRLEGP